MLPADLLNPVIFFYATAQLESFSEAILLDAGKGFRENRIMLFTLNLWTFFFFSRGNYWFVSILYTALQRFNAEERFIPWRNTRHDCPASCPLSTFSVGMLFTAALTYKSFQLVSNNINYICMPLSYYFIQLYSKTFSGVEACGQISWYKVNLKNKI